MKVTATDDRVEITDLTEQQWSTAIEWMDDEIINREVWEDDHTRIVLHNPTEEQLEALKSELEAAG